MTPVSKMLGKVVNTPLYYSTVISIHSGHLRFLKKSSLCTGVRHIKVFSYWSIVIPGVKKQHTVMGSETLIKQIITYKTLNLVLVGNIST